MVESVAARSPEPQCTECDAPLASRILPNGVVTVGETSVAFRRDTDYLVCERCFATFRVQDVRAGHPLPV
jgi:hypothetical protein